MNITSDQDRDTRTSARTMAKPINFFCFAPKAQSAYLAGDFNGWNCFSHPMRRQLDGSCFIQVFLTHGHHRYQFLVDGEPTLDPKAMGVGRNEWNKRGSLVAVS